MTPPSADSPGLIVMYHYVRPDRSNIPTGIRPLLVSEFEAQLDWLLERYDIVRPDEFMRAIELSNRCKHEPLSKPPCLLTFDDGTRDHAEVVAPILARRGLGGLFFVLSWPAELRKMPLTHAVHWLLGLDEREVWHSFQRHARDRLSGEQALGDPIDAARIYHYESQIRGRIKYAANMALPAEEAERVIQSAVIAAGRTMGDLAEEWFVSASDIRDMHSAGMTIASHGCSHRSIQTLGVAGMCAEIRHASDYITGLTGCRPAWFAPPFGASGASAQSIDAMRKTMKESGILASVSTEKRYVFRGDDAYALPRLDAIDLPPRKRFP